MPARMPVLLLGAGAIGRMHAERCQRHPDVALAGLADPSDAGRAYAHQLGVPWFADPLAAMDALRPGAVVVATPNTTHLPLGLACIARGLPVLMEKPVADTVANAQTLVDAATAAGVPLMVGHQRRHNPIVRRARQLVADGVLGRPVCATAMATWLKPDSYFDAAWRREPGGGPVLINLIHDIDLLRHVWGESAGEVTEVQAITANAVRGFAVEDTAAVLLRFAHGALATVTVSDAAVAPWNWDLAAGEAAHYAQQAVDSHFLSGTEGSLTLPRLSVWRFRGARGWHDELTEARSAVHRADPYDEQLRHLRAVAEGRETPVCSGLEGLRTLAVTLAVHESAQLRRPIAVGV